MKMLLPVMQEIDLRNLSMHDWPEPAHSVLMALIPKLISPEQPDLFLRELLVAKTEARLMQDPFEL